MGCEELIQAIGEKARGLREEILARAAAEARAITREAEGKRDGLLSNARARGAADARGEASGIVSSARLQARRELLAARHEKIESVLQALETQLGQFSSTAAYRGVLGVLLAECLAESPAPVTVRCRPEDLALVAELARRQGREIRVEETDLPGGGVETVAGTEGRFVCRNTLAERMERARPLLLQEAGRLLFGPQAAGEPSRKAPESCRATPTHGGFSGAS